MKKILVIHILGIEYEGITSVIYNYCFSMNKEGLQFDILSPNHVPDELKKKFALVGSVIEVPNRKKQLPNYCKSLYGLLKKNNYDVVHIHGNSGTMMIETCMAKMNRVSKIIVHCHNTACNHPFFNMLMTPIMISTADYLLCCSEEAGKWLYGNSKYYVFNNAINTERFHYNEKSRQQARDELRIKDEFVFGHVGHFTKQKNHIFLLELYSELEKELPDTKLILVGDGPDSENLHKRVCSLGLEKKVIFIGKCQEPEKMYFAMDMFLFPSKWEGLGLALIEAQASGLQCVASDRVPRESNVTGSVKYISCKNIEEWKNYIISYIRSYTEKRLFMSENNINKIRQEGYDITVESQKLRTIY